MSGITFPLILTVIAIITALSAYQGIRRGGARYYTLERESMLRRARLTLLGSLLLFLAAIALLVYGRQQLLDGDGTIQNNGQGDTGAATTDSSIQTQPPTPSPSATPDPSVPTPTVTPVICRAVVDGTAGSGLTLRDAPSGADIEILPDGTILTILDTDPVEATGFVWRNVRTVSRQEGWVVEEFLIIGECN